MVGPSPTSGLDDPAGKWQNRSRDPMIDARDRLVLPEIVTETLFAESVRNLRLPALVSNAELRYVAVNAAAAELLGYTRETLLRSRVDEIVERSRWQLVHASHGVEQAGFRTGTVAVRRGDGEIIDVNYLSIKTQIALLPHILSFLWN
jgi:PAS domain S-box-containing protein